MKLLFPSFEKAVFLVLIGTFLYAESPLYWEKQSLDVHANFKGNKGTVALIGDSITEDVYFWTTMKEGVTNADFDADKVLKYMESSRWAKKGAIHGNCSGWQIIDAKTVIDAVISTDNPEVAIIMLGTNDMMDVEYTVEEFKEELLKMITVFHKNGTVVILSTIPPRKVSPDGPAKYNKAIRGIAEEKKIPLIELYDFVETVNHDIWPLFKDGTHFKWGGKNDFSREAMKENGVAVRNYITLKKYFEVYEKVLK